MKSTRKEILTGDEVVFLGKPKHIWRDLGDYNLLKEGEAYIVHFATSSQVSIVGVPGLHNKSLFKRI